MIHYKSVNKLKWWYNVAAMPGKRYLKKLFNKEWNFLTMKRQAEEVPE